MIETLSCYLPQDRLRALTFGEGLPDRTTGSALFADISGFTALAEYLVDTLGARRGAEELSHQLNRVYDALIAEVECYAGSVINFAGDALMCWFDEKTTLSEQQLASSMISVDSSLRATSCALAMQAAMREFAQVTIPSGVNITLAMKATVASGPVRRFVIGDCNIQLLDVLAGRTLERIAVAQQLALKDEVLVDEATWAQIQTAATLIEWRNQHECERFAVVGELHGSWMPPDLDIPAEIKQPAADMLSCWLLPAVYERLQAGAGEFLTELRPVVAMFIQFAGIDYDANNEAEQQLNAYVQWMQRVIARYDGALLNIITGDKGCYIYAAFGALTVHEDDARRAVYAALELRMPPAELSFIRSTKIGLSRGVARVGIYGGTTRRTYDVLGDEVNLAARLMQAARPGQIVVSGRIQYATAKIFNFETIPAITLKGKSQPVTAFVLNETAWRKNYHLLDPFYSLPMVGRQAELELIAEKMEQATQGQGQIVAITAEAGMGKSRLVAEAIRLAQRRGFTGYGGACQSDGTNIPYLVWRAILGDFFGVDASDSQEKQIQWLATTIENFAPQRRSALPLIAGVLGLSLPDNDFTRGLGAKERKSAIEAALVDCVRGAAQAAQSGKSALLFVLEDLHWLDALSRDLLETIGYAIANLPVLIVLARRPPEQERPSALGMEALAHFTQMVLAELSPTDCTELIRAKVAQLHPQHQEDELPAGLIEQLTAQAQGNPFYLEELLNYLRDHNLNPYNPATVNQLGLPTSLHTLILSRMDRLSEREKMVLKVACIIGRVFRVAWLQGYYPALGDLKQIQLTLNNLQQADITLVNAPEPELTYLFKHIITHQVVYDSLPHAQRAQLHEQLAHYLEATYTDRPLLNRLAYHYEKSDNLPKKVEYLRKAGHAAQAAFANEAALGYYARLLPLLTEPAERIELQLQWGAVLELIGQWDDAETRYRNALQLAQANLDLAEGAAVWASHLALGKLSRRRGDYDAALQWLEPARAGLAALGDQADLSEVLIEMSSVYQRKNDYPAAQRHLEEGLALARALGDRAGMATAIHRLGGIAWGQKNYAAALSFYEESLSLRRELGDKPGLAQTLNSLGAVHHQQGDYAAELALYEESLALARMVGDRASIANSLMNQGTSAHAQGDHAAARRLLEESLAIYREIGNKEFAASALNNLGNIAIGQNDYAAARVFHEESLALKRETGNKWGMALSFTNLGSIAYLQGDYAAAWDFHEKSLAMCAEINNQRGSIYARLGLGLVALAQGQTAAARQFIAESLRLHQETGDRRGTASCLAGLAGAAIASDDFQDAARLAAAAEALLVSIAAKMDTDVRPLYERTVAAARAALGEAAFAAAWVEGQKMTLEQAITLALDGGNHAGEA